MNCEPGDLVRAFKPCPLQDKLFFVLHAAPVGVWFQLPDGCWHEPVKPGYWVLESAGAPIEVNMVVGRRLTRLTRFGVGADAGLRPIRGQDGQDETLTWKAVPKQKEHA